jgi:hypothetical protein
VLDELMGAILMMASLVPGAAEEGVEVLLRKLFDVFPSLRSRYDLGNRPRTQSNQSWRLMMVSDTSPSCALLATAVGLSTPLTQDLAQELAGV